MVERVEATCQVCSSSVGFEVDNDGFFYCRCCSSRAEDIVQSAIDDEQIHSIYTASGGNRVRPANAIDTQPISQVKPTTSQFLDLPDILDHDHPNIEDAMDDGVGPTQPSDFGSSQGRYSNEDYCIQIRSRYVRGLQLMIQLQSQALVEKFNVSPLIIGLVGPLWLRFLASTKIMAEEWGLQALHDSEAPEEVHVSHYSPCSTLGVDLFASNMAYVMHCTTNIVVYAGWSWSQDFISRCTSWFVVIGFGCSSRESVGGVKEVRSRQSSAEHRNIFGKHVANVCCTSLRRGLPLSSSLAISLLVCHVAREPILPTDILKWALEGSLPYFAAFVEIEKQQGSCPRAFPISVSRMLRPVQPISSQKLEAMAADIAQKIGLTLPPVNFHAIASRYLRQLSLPAVELLPSACHIYEWSMPSELYLSANEFRIPTRACVMSILIVAVRILFDINGYGMWESSFSNADTEPPRSSIVQLLQILHEKYYEVADAHEYSCDLPNYLQYCKDVVFHGLNPSFEDVQEKELIEALTAFYQNKKGVSNDSGSREDDARTTGDQSTPRKGDESHNGDDHCPKCSTDQSNCSHRGQDSAHSSRTPKEKAMRKLKLDMEENHFCYIPPRVKVKRRDYLHYARKRKGVLIYAVHADYYILLRCCAKIALVETRIMHIAVLSLERRLQWLEKRIDHSLKHLSLDDVCGFCEGDAKIGENAL